MKSNYSKDDWFRLAGLFGMVFLVLGVPSFIYLEYVLDPLMDEFPLWLEYQTEKGIKDYALYSFNNTGFKEIFGEEATPELEDQLTNKMLGVFFVLFSAVLGPPVFLVLPLIWWFWICGGVPEWLVKKLKYYPRMGLSIKYTFRNKKRTINLKIS